MFEKQPKKIFWKTKIHVLSILMNLCKNVKEFKVLKLRNIQSTLKSKNKDLTDS